MKEQKSSPDESMKAGISNLAESFVLPLADKKHRFKGFIIGFIFPLLYIGIGWLFLVFLWHQFILSLTFVFDHRLDFILIAMVFSFFSALSYYWFQLSRSILSAARSMRNIVPEEDAVGAGIRSGLIDRSADDIASEGGEGIQAEPMDGLADGRVAGVVNGMVTEKINGKVDGRGFEMIDDIDFKMKFITPYDQKYERPLGGLS